MMLTDIMSYDDFEFWARKTREEHDKAFAKSKFLYERINYDIKTTLIYNMQTGKNGFSKCSMKDSFDPDIGRAIAWMRYCYPDFKVPIIAERVSYEELNVGDWIWHRSGENESYEKFMIERKSIGTIGANLPYQATTFDFDLVSEDGLRREHVSHFDCCYCTGLKKFWKVID